MAQKVWAIIKFYAFAGCSPPDGLYPDRESALARGRLALQGTGGEVWIVPYEIGRPIKDGYTPSMIKGAEQVLP